MTENPNRKRNSRKFLFWFNFIFLILASAMLSFSIYFYTNKSEINNYRYIAGREQMADTVKITKYLRPENVSTEDRKKIWKKVASSYNPNPDLYFYAGHYLYNVENYRNVFEKSELEFYAKASVDAKLTADSRALATMEVFNIFYYNRQYQEEILKILHQYPPYPGLLGGLKNTVDIDFALLQLSFDTYKENGNYARFLYLLTGVMQYYKYSNNVNTQEYLKYKNIYENLISHPRVKFLEKNYLEKLDYLNNREQAINFLSYFISQVRLAELGYPGKAELTEQLKDKALILSEDTKFDDVFVLARYLFHVHFAKIKYFLYKNDVNEAKSEVDKLERLLLGNEALFILLTNSVYLQSDVGQIKKNFPNFLNNVKI